MDVLLSMVNAANALLAHIHVELLFIAWFREIAAKIEITKINFATIRRLVRTLTDGYGRAGRVFLK